MLADSEAPDVGDTEVAKAVCEVCVATTVERAPVQDGHEPDVAVAIAEVFNVGTIEGMCVSGPFRVITEQRGGTAVNLRGIDILRDARETSILSGGHNERLTCSGCWTERCTLKLSTASRLTVLCGVAGL